MKRIATLALLLIPAETRAETQEQCVARWERATLAGLVAEVYMDGSTPTFVVDEQAWNQVDYNTKAGIMNTFECAMTKPGEALMKAQAVSNLTRKVLGRLSWGKFTVEKP